MNKVFQVRLLLFATLLFGMLIMNNCKEVSDPVYLSCNSAGYYYFDSTTRMILPNAFTPNGDSLNDTFGAVGLNISDFSIKITTDSGTVLFYDTSITHFWNGKNLKGKVVEGFYTAEIHFTDINGSSITHTMEITLYAGRPDKTAAKDCKFADMINPYFGFIYPTIEFIQ